MAKRKIKIGSTYETTTGGSFYVSRIEQGKKMFKTSGHFKGCKERVAIDENGKRIGITKLTNEISAIQVKPKTKIEEYGGLGREIDEPFCDFR